VKERLIKFAAMVVLAPFLTLAMAGLAGLMLFLPVIALVAPRLIKFKDSDR
jgi:hypothetical protein